jgi:hypothetical protein
LLFKTGRLYSAGPDFNVIRNEELQPLSRFVPAHKDTSYNNGAKENSIFRYFLGQGAFLINGLKKKGGHLFAQNLKLAYIRIPKSANTSMSAAMLKSIYPDLKNIAVTPQQINYLADVNLTTIHSNPLEPITYFTVVRNPFARLVSVYHDFFESNNNHFIYHDYLFGILTRDLSFEEFVNRIALIPDIFKDQHLRPQQLFLSYYQLEKKNVRIFKLEEIESLQKFLSGYNLKLEHLNKSDAYDYHAYYNERTLQKVFEIYKNDVALFGYSTAYKNLKSIVSSKLKTVHF